MDVLNWAPMPAFNPGDDTITPRTAPAWRAIVDHLMNNDWAGFPALLNIGCQNSDLSPGTVRDLILRARGHELLKQRYMHDDEYGLTVAYRRHLLGETGGGA
jgi:hypothetical protein